MADSSMTLDDLFAYCADNAEIRAADYGGRNSYWNTDRSRRDAQRRKVMQRFGCMSWGMKLKVSTNGRLAVHEDRIHYTAGQYAPTEIWDHCYDYLHNLVTERL